MRLCFIRNKFNPENYFLFNEWSEIFCCFRRRTKIEIVRLHPLPKAQRSLPLDVKEACHESRSFFFLFFFFSFLLHLNNATYTNIQWGYNLLPRRKEILRCCAKHRRTYISSIDDGELARAIVLIIHLIVEERKKKRKGR